MSSDLTPSARLPDLHLSSLLLSPPNQKLQAGYAPWICPQEQPSVGGSGAKPHSPAKQDIWWCGWTGHSNTPCDSCVLCLVQQLALLPPKAPLSARTVPPYPPLSNGLHYTFV